MTDQQLQLSLARMLPEKIMVKVDGLFWVNQTDSWREMRLILDTEWLHACWVMEQTLNGRERLAFVNILFEKFSGGVSWDEASTRQVFFPFICASWQQRAAALCRVKGVNA